MTSNVTNAPPSSTALDHDAAHAQHDDGQRRDADDHDRVDDPLDDDRAEDRRAADALPLPEGVARTSSPRRAGSTLFARYPR